MRRNRLRSFFLIIFVAGLAWLGIPLAGQNENADRQAQAALQAATNKELVDGNLEAAIQQYKQIIDRYTKTSRATAATALLQLGRAYDKLGNIESQKAYDRIVREFADQKYVAEIARARLAAYETTAASQTKLSARVVWSGSDRSATPSPDGLYVSHSDNNGDVAIRDLRTNIERRLNNTSGWAQYMGEGIISPDGRQIAYTWYDDRNKASTVDLRVASIASGEPVRNNVILQTEQRDYYGPKAWTPDGKQLVVFHGLPDRTAQIGIVTLQTRSYRNIKSLEWRSPNVISLSPDARYITYDVPATDAGSPRDIFVLAVDGSMETAVVRNPANDSSPMWSSDGAYLFFLSDRRGSNGLWALPMKDGRADGAPQLIKPDVGPISLQGMTKNGTLFYFEPPDTRQNLYTTELNGLRATKPPIAASERLTNRNIGVTWSRDGEYLAYYSFRPNSASDFSDGILVIRSGKTGEERTIPLPTRVSSRFGAGPKWFPDNRSFLIEIGDAQGPGFGFYRLTFDTGNTELLAHLAREVSAYDLSADGKAIFYGGLGTGPLLRLDIETHRETVIASSERENLCP